jgi:hypothetical protein
LSTFEYLSVALSFVIGLAVTYLLSSLLSLFRERRTCRPDWLALLWAGYVFTYQVQFWWALFEASAMHNWTLPQFFGLLAFSLLLFGAGGLVIPHDAARHPEGLRAYFEADGRWGVALLSAYFVLAPPLNLWFFGTPILDPLNVSIFAMGLFGLAFLRLTDRRRQVVHSVLFGIVAAGLFVWMSPWSY